METLFKEEAVAEKRLLDARASERMAEAEVHSALARHGQLGGTGGIAIRAPMSGTVADVAVAPGAFVNEGAPLFHVANTARLWLEARVPESEVGRLGKPGGAAFSVDGFGQPFVIEAGKKRQAGRRRRRGRCHDAHGAGDFRILQSRGQSAPA